VKITRAVTFGLIVFVSCHCGPTERVVRPNDDLPDEVAPNPNALEVHRAAGGPWNERSSIGTNLAALVDYSAEQPLLDVFKLSRAWISGNANAWDDGRPIATDERGWVRSLADGQIARTLMLWDVTTYRAGRYFVSYEGRGRIVFPTSSATRVVETETRPGRFVLDVDPERATGGILLEIHETDPNDPIRNIRVVPEGGACERDVTKFCSSADQCGGGECLSFEEHHSELVFHPDFLAGVKRYAVLRFMDWFSTNNSELARFDDRPELEDARYTVIGAPLELAIDLANRLHAEPWITIPHLADDDYQRRFAAIVRDRLDPSLRVWVEYSNEVWNGMFAQARWAGERGASSNLSSNAFESQLRFYSERSVEVFRIWKQELGRRRVVGVLATQAANPWSSEVVLDWQDANEIADALAIAPYFGVNVGQDELARFSQMTPDQLFEHTRRSVMPEVYRWIDETAAIARERDVPLVSYEGGQHFIGMMGAENDERLNRLLDAINRDPRMGELYSEYLREWRSRGGGLFVHFNNCDQWSKWGRWGARESLRPADAEAPKYRALMRFIDQNPRWW
jgi:hypothetical protein